MEGKTVGQAHLDSKKPEINVRLSYTSHPRELGAILAHEATHHYLDRVSFRARDLEENERLTDLVAMYLGFGKLMLNGSDVRYDPVENPKKLGCLTMSDLACAYDKICCLNGIPIAEWETNLSVEATYYVQSRASARQMAMTEFQ